MDNNQVPTNKSKGNKTALIVILVSVISLLVIVGVVLLAFFLIGNSAPREKIYLTDKEIPLLYGSPNNYKKKYLKLPAMVYMVKYDKKSQLIYAYTDMDDYTNIVVIHYPDKSVSVKENDYIIFDGYVNGSEKNSNYPVIEAETVKVVSYKEAVAPTTKEVNVDKTVSQNDVSVTINKIEFSDVETRVYVKATNNSKYEFSLYSYSSFLTQSGKQYETTYSKNAVDLSSTILAGGTTEGVIVFPKVEQNNLSITMKGYSSNYSLDFKNFAFDIVVN